MTRLHLALPLAGALLLAACGGSDSPGATPTPAPTPSPTPPDVTGVVMTPFVQRARENPCGQYDNRLFVVDRKYVFTAVKGSCGTPAQYTLYGATPGVVVCSDQRSPVRKVEDCSDPAMFPVFKRLIEVQQSAPDFVDGLSLQEVLFLPKDGSYLPLSPLKRETSSSIQAPRQMVIRDAATLATVWAEHHAGRPNAASIALPKVVFKNEMVIALFGGAGGPCHRVGLRSLRVSGDKLVAGYTQGDDGTAGKLCADKPASPMEMVVVERSEAPVVFEAMVPDTVAFSRIEMLQRTQTGAARQVVIKDAQSLAALWKEQQQTAPLPNVDFSRQMVLAAFLGEKTDGTFGIQIDGIERIGGKLRVTLAESILNRHTPGTPGSSAVTPASVVLLERADLPVEFVTQIVQFR